MVSARPAAIDRVFGAGFAKKIEGLESGRWSGPITSSYGWHLVRIDAVVPGGQPSFEIVRAQVERDFAYQRQQESEAALIERLKQQYEIVIEEAAR
jgi:parvulin-like peptidyl-prolyl isomerase